MNKSIISQNRKKYSVFPILSGTFPGLFFPEGEWHPAENREILVFLTRKGRFAPLLFVKDVV